MDNIPSRYEGTILISLVSLSDNTLKDKIVHLRGKLGDLQNQRRKKLSMETI